MESLGAYFSDTETSTNNSLTAGTLDLNINGGNTAVTNPVNKSADDTAAMMEVTTLNYDGSSLLSSVSDVNSNGYKDVYDLTRANLAGMSGINASATKDFQIAVKLTSETGNDFQTDGVTITMTFTLKQ